MAHAGTAKARELLEGGAYLEAGDLFLKEGELPSAARAFVCAKDYFKAAKCYEDALRPLDAARLYLQIRHWHKAAELYAQAGDSMRSELALEQFKREQEAIRAQDPSAPRPPKPAPEGPAQETPEAQEALLDSPFLNADIPEMEPPPPSPPPQRGAGTPVTTPPQPPKTVNPRRPTGQASPAAPPQEPVPIPEPVKETAPQLAWPKGEIWECMRVGDVAGAGQIYLSGASRSGWELMEEADGPEVRRALAEALFQAGDHAVAAEAFRKAGDDLRSAQCLSLAGLNEEAADLYARCGQTVVAAQHLEKARAWEQAAMLYLQENMHMEAARCHEKDDDPVKAAALYLKAKKPDLALPLLQSVAPAHRSFRPCRLLAAKILFQKEQRVLALAMLSPLLDGALRNEDELDASYQAAVLLEQSGALEVALETYGRLQAAHFGFRDVAQRLEKVKAAAPPPPASPPQGVHTASPGARPSGQPDQPSPKPPVLDPAHRDLAPLRECTLLHRLGLEDIRRLRMIGRSGDCKPGQVLLRGGQVAPGLIIVLQGGLTITPDPGDPTLASGFLGPGDYVGLGCIIQGPPQPNALVAQKDTRLLLLPQKALEDLLATEPDLGMRFYRSVAEHLVQTLMAEKAKTDKV